LQIQETDILRAQEQKESPVAAELIGETDELQDMPQGTGKWCNEEKGYGFITPKDGSEHLFVHHPGIVGSGFKSLEEGASVSHEVAQARKGMQAANVSEGSTDGPDSRAPGNSLRVPLKVEGATRILSEHFEPDDFTGRWQRRYAGSDDGGTMPSRV
jgi:CspA family cold shock protein